jgi:hypothetical protein
MAITAKRQHKCAGDKDCTCNGLIKHAHHICRTAGCACHQAEAYGLVAVTVEHEAVYVPAQVQRLTEPTP